VGQAAYLALTCFTMNENMLMAVLANVHSFLVSAPPATAAAVQLHGLLVRASTVRTGASEEQYPPVSLQP
jgi:hypothetical protein